MASPETLGQYETVVPGMAERLLRVHESQTVQVADREDRIVASDIELAKGGQGWAGFLALICVVPAIVMLFTGNLAGGAILLSMPVTLLVASFIPRSKTKA